MAREETIFDNFDKNGDAYTESARRGADAQRRSSRECYFVISAHDIAWLFMMAMLPCGRRK